MRFYLSNRFGSVIYESNWWRKEMISISLLKNNGGQELIGIDLHLHGVLFCPLIQTRQVIFVGGCKLGNNS